MNYIGIDPGYTGGIAILDEKAQIVELYDMPVIAVGKTKKELDGPGIVKILENYSRMILSQDSHVFIEKCQSMPRQGVVGVGRYMEGYGRLRGICEGLSLPYTLVRPQTWKKEMMPDMDTKEKGQSIVRAKQLYPDIDLPRKKDHGLADAVLIGRHGWQTLGGGR